MYTVSSQVGMRPESHRDASAQSPEVASFQRIADPASVAHANGNKKRSNHIENVEGRLQVTRHQPPKQKKKDQES